MLACTLCDKSIGDCACPGRDEKLRELAFSPVSCTAFKWCRKCNRHYARCKCLEPDFYVLYRGQDITEERLRNIEGQVVRPNLNAR